MVKKADVLKKIQDFVIQNNEAPTAWRSELVRNLTDELESEGVTRALYWMWRMRHPSLLRKSAAYQTIGDILADFIMNVGEVAERLSEYPVRGAEKRYREEVRSNERELLLRYDRSDHDSDYCPRGTIFADSIAMTNSVEDVLFFERTDMTAEELTEMLASTQRDPSDVIEQYADGSPWNAEEIIKRRTAQNVTNAVMRLDMRRVKVCEVCGNAFYSHSVQPKRVKVCDVLPHYKFKPQSVCQVERDRLLAKIRKAKRKAA